MTAQAPSSRLRPCAFYSHSTCSRGEPFASVCGAAKNKAMFGSAGYVSNHFATLSYSTKPEEQVVPVFLRQQTGPIAIKPEHAKFDAYFNTDNGGGKFLGIFTEGNSAVANIFQQWTAPISDLGFTTITLRNTGSTDHVSFDPVGLPGFQFIQDPATTKPAAQTPTRILTNVSPSPI
jgi:hypothetical protein